MSRVATFDGVPLHLEGDADVRLIQKMFTRHDLSKFPFEQVTKQVKTATDSWRRERTLTDNFVWLMLSPEDWTPEGRGFCAAANGKAHIAFKPRIIHIGWDRSPLHFCRCR